MIKRFIGIEADGSIQGITLHDVDTEEAIGALKGMLDKRSIIIPDVGHSGFGLIVNSSGRHMFFTYLPRFLMKTYWAVHKTIYDEEKPKLTYVPCWANLGDSTFATVEIGAPAGSQFVLAYDPETKESYFGLATKDGVNRLPITNCYNDSHMCIPYEGRSHALNAIAALRDRLNEYQWNADLAGHTVNIKEKSMKVFSATPDLEHIQTPLENWLSCTTRVSKSLFKELRLPS